MFLSKNICCMKNITKLPGCTVIEKALSQKCFSNLAPATSTPTPDKLYKKIEIEVRGNDQAVLKSYGLFTTTTASHLGITAGRNTTPQKHQFQRWTVLKSAHVHKKHRVQYEMRTYYRYMDFWRLTGSTADTFLEYLQRNLPEGVAMKVTKVEIERLFGAVTCPPKNNV